MARKRYNLTLSEENVNGFQDILRKHGLPLSVMSSAVDVYLHDVSQAMEKILDQKGGFHMMDFFGFLSGVTSEVTNKKEVQNNVQQISSSKKTKRSVN